jgi:hypothetical protein
LIFSGDAQYDGTVRPGSLRMAVISRSYSKAAPKEICSLRPSGRDLYSDI